MRHALPFALMCLLVVAACNAAPALESGRSASPTTPNLPSPVATVAPTPAITSPSRTAPAGMFLLTGHVVGSVSTDLYSVVAPAGWHGGENILPDGDSFIAGLKVTLVAAVPSDPCHWKGSLVTPGPTVDDLVELLVAQRLRNASTPVDVTLAGYSGKYLEWSVPEDMVVTGDADFQGCDAADSGHPDFISWIDRAGGHRYHKVAGERDRLWILDVEGRTTVVDIAYAPSAPARIRDELFAIVATLAFDAP